MSYVQYHLHNPLLMKLVTNGASHPHETIECPVRSLGVPSCAKVRIYFDYHHASTQHHSSLDGLLDLAKIASVYKLFLHSLFFLSAAHHLLTIGKAICSPLSDYNQLSGS